MVFLNGGPAHALNPAFSFFVRCNSQEEIDSYWDKLIEGGKPMACGWLIDRFGLCWQIVPRNIGELISHPKAMEAMMGMIKMDPARAGSGRARGPESLFLVIAEEILCWLVRRVAMFRFSTAQTGIGETAFL
jgi:hypothetical protein